MLAPAGLLETDSVAVSCARRVVSDEHRWAGRLEQPGTPAELAPGHEGAAATGQSIGVAVQVLDNVK